MICLGVSQHSKAYVSDILVDLGLKPAFNPTNKRQPLLLEYNEFLDNLGVLNKNSRASQVVIVFASVLRLAEFEGLTPLDNEKARDFGFTLRPLTKTMVKAALKLPPAKVTRPRKDFLGQLISAAVKGSFLSPFMTVIYGLPSRVQTEARKRILLSIAETGKPTLPKSLASHAALCGRLVAVLDSEAGRKFCAALHTVWHAKSKAMPTKAQGIKFGVEPYELRYAVKLLRGTKHKREPIDGKTLKEVYDARRRGPTAATKK